MSSLAEPKQIGAHHRSITPPDTRPSSAKHLQSRQPLCVFPDLAFANETDAAAFVDIGGQRLDGCHHPLRLEPIDRSLSVRTG